MYGEAIDITKQLISVPSPSGSEGKILEFVGGWLRTSGFSNVEVTDKFCAGKVQGTKSEEAVILCGHIDTVVPGSLSAWKHDPCQPVLHLGKLYGLGASDMKAGVAVQMAVAKAMLTRKPGVDIWLAAVANEEVDGAGSEAFANWFTRTQDYQQVSCVIAEPTDLERVEVGHRGNRFTQLTFHGTAGHASQQASYEKSSLNSAQQFLADLSKLARQAEEIFTDALLGSPSIVPTVMQSGDPLSPNKTSETTTVVVDIRTTPGLDKAFDSWMEHLADLYHFTWQYAQTPLPSAMCSRNAKILRAVQEASGITELSVSKGATDQVIFQRRGIDTVVFGPGEFALAHVQNEYVLQRKIKEACDIYEKIVLGI